MVTRAELSIVMKDGECSGKRNEAKQAGQFWWMGDVDDRCGNKRNGLRLLMFTAVCMQGCKRNVKRERGGVSGARAKCTGGAARQPEIHWRMHSGGCRACVSVSCGEGKHHGTIMVVAMACFGWDAFE